MTALDFERFYYPIDGMWGAQRRQEEELFHTEKHAHARGRGEPYCITLHNAAVIEN